jgi:excinuclease UvrABC nuclease subunit
METAAKDLDFVEAARLRDRMKSYQDHLKNWFFQKLLPFVFLRSSQPYA